MEKGMKEFHWIRTPIIWYLFLFWSWWAHALLLICSCCSLYILSISFLKRAIFHQATLKRYERVSFGMYIHTLVFVLLSRRCSKNRVATFVAMPLTCSVAPLSNNFIFHHARWKRFYTMPQVHLKEVCSISFQKSFQYHSLVLHQHILF